MTPILPRPFWSHSGSRISSTVALDGSISASACCQFRAIGGADLLITRSAHLDGNNLSCRKPGLRQLSARFAIIIPASTSILLMLLALSFRGCLEFAIGCDTGLWDHGFALAPALGAFAQGVCSALHQVSRRSRHSPEAVYCFTPFSIFTACLDVRYALLVRWLVIRPTGAAAGLARRARRRA